MSTDGMLEEWGTRLFHGMPKKGKQNSDGKLIGAATLVAASLMSAGSVRAQVRAAVRPHAKQVMVKITGGGRGMKAVAAHFRYISRLGKPEVGGKGKVARARGRERRQGRGQGRDRGAAVRLAAGGKHHSDESHRREVFNIVLSMPEGTPADQVRDAARAFAKETFASHKYVFALHDDTGSPHVHLAVRAERMTGTGSIRARRICSAGASVSLRGCRIGESMRLPCVPRRVGWRRCLSSSGGFKPQIKDVSASRVRTQERRSPREAARSRRGAYCKRTGGVARGPGPQH